MNYWSALAPQKKQYGNISYATWWPQTPSWNTWPTLTNMLKHFLVKNFTTKNQLIIFERHAPAQPFHPFHPNHPFCPIQNPTRFQKPSVREMNLSHKCHACHLLFTKCSEPWAILSHNIRFEPWAMPCKIPIRPFFFGVTAPQAGESIHAGETGTDDKIFRPSPTEMIKSYNPHRQRW